MSVTSYQYLNVAVVTFSTDKQKTHKEIARHDNLCDSHIPEQLYQQLLQFLSLLNETKPSLL